MDEDINVAQKQVFFGSVGPLLYDDSSFYAIDTDGKARVQAPPTSDNEVLRYQDAILMSGDQIVAGHKTFSGEVELDGALNHDGTTVGFYGATPATQASASADLTDNTGATANYTVEDVPAAAGDAGGVVMVSAAANVATVASVNTALTAVENDIADLAAKVNKCLTVLRTLGLMAT